MVSDRQHPVTTADDGDYWRLLVPGSYEIQASIDGYKPQRKVVEVDQEKVTILDFHLKPSQEDFEGEQSTGVSRLVRRENKFPRRIKDHILSV